MQTSAEIELEMALRTIRKAWAVKDEDGVQLQLANELLQKAAGYIEAAKVESLNYKATVTLEPGHKPRLTVTLARPDGTPLKYKGTATLDRDGTIGTFNGQVCAKWDAGLASFVSGDSAISTALESVLYHVMTELFS